MHSADTVTNRGSQQSGELDRLVEDRTRDLTAFSSHLQAFSEQEKAELARKLHDELGGLLTAAKMDLSWLQSRVVDSPFQERLAQLGAVLDEAMELKRRVVEGLRPSLLDHFGLPTAVRAYLESTCEAAGLQSEIEVEHSCDSLSKDAAIGLFRVVQEGLTNIMRHAQARRVKLTLKGDGRRCTLVLSDDGRGFDAKDPQLRRSHGLMGMRQRVSALGGRLEVESRPGSGTTLRAEIPLHPAG